MSSGRRFPFEEAFEIASEAVEVLKPTVEKLKAVGSLRRQRETVGDLEFLAIPFFDEDLFGGSPTPILDPLERALRSLGAWKKGGSRHMQITDLMGHQHLQLDLFIVHPPAEWGSLLAIRTGPAALGILSMMGLNKRGFSHLRGGVYKKNTLHPTPTEEEFFKLAGIEYVLPFQRDELAERLKKQEAGS